MATLNHVCMWNGNHWERITAEEASKRFPNCKVPARSHVFVCELCGQAVTLTDSEKRIRYFRHNKWENNKNCPERSKNTGYTTFKNGEHGLPFKIIISEDKKSFSFALGMIPVPEDLLKSAGDKYIKISTGKKNERTFQYLLERIDPETVTYLPVGEEPAETYYLSVDSKFKDYWPSEVNGITEPHVLFDGETGKLLVRDSEVTVKREYFFLTNRRYRSVSLFGDESLEFQLLCQRENVYLYQLKCLSYSTDAANFFWKMHYRLTDAPVSIQPIWPLYQETPYVIRHGKEFIYFFINGNNDEKNGSGIRMKVFPEEPYRTFNDNSITVFKVRCRPEWQMISAGRAHVLTFRYFYQKKLNNTGAVPIVKVTDLQGNNLTQGVYTKFPPFKAIVISCEYDGKVLAYEDTQILCSHKLNANDEFRLNDLHYGEKVDIYQGLDLVYHIEFKRVKKAAVSAEREKHWMKLLRHSSGANIQVGVNIANSILNLKEYPAIQKWVLKKVKKGYMPEDALRIIKSILLNFQK